LAAIFAGAALVVNRRQPATAQPARARADAKQPARADAKQPARADAKQPDKRAAEPGRSVEKGAEVQKNYPITLRLAKHFDQAIVPEVMHQAIDEARSSLLNDLGVQAPEIGYRQDARLAPHHFSIDLDGVPVSEGDIEPNSVLVENNIADLEILKITY